MQIQNNNQIRLKINYFIKSPEVKVVDEEGNFLGIMRTNDAIRLATEQGKDLIEINSRSNPPLAKIIAKGKFLYDEKKKANAQKKSQKVSELKEIVFRPTTEEHDLNHKLSAAKEFLVEGHKVKLTVKFKGRELAHPEVGREKLEFALKQFSNIVFTPILAEGKTLSTIVSNSK